MVTRNPMEALTLWPATGRLLAFDYGSKRVGVAVSDSARTVALARKPHTGGVPEQCKLAVALARETGAVGMVVGLPLNMGGDHGPLAQAAQSFAHLLETQGGLPVLLWDERLTSRQAENAFFEQRVAGSRQTRASKKDSSGQVDSTAAVLILQNVLDALR